MNISILGPAGSGKGTISQRLAKEAGLRIFNTGATLREWAEENDPALANKLAAGGMASSGLVIRLMGEETGRDLEGFNGWIIDGTPRAVDQAEEILKGIKTADFNLDAVVVLECDDSILMERLLSRVSCNKCGTSYSKTVRSDRCIDSCGGVLSARQDDQVEGIAKRLDLYRSTTLPAISTLEDFGVPVRRIKATGSPEVVYGRVKEALMELGLGQEGRGSKQVPGIGGPRNRSRNKY